MIHPPSPSYVLHIDEYADTFFSDSGWGVDRAQLAAMQEALTAEWLIDGGFMPCPSEAHCYESFGYEDIVDGWLVVDRDPHGKPSDYEVKR